MPQKPTPTPAKLDPSPATPLWQIIAQTLPSIDAESEWLTLANIAPLLGLKPHALSKHARDLWPAHEGHWRLDHAQAVALIRRVVHVGRRLPSRSVALSRLATKRGEAKC